MNNNFNTSITLFIVDSFVWYFRSSENRRESLKEEKEKEDILKIWIKYGFGYYKIARFFKNVALTYHIKK